MAPGAPPPHYGVAGGAGSSFDPGLQQNPYAYNSGAGPAGAAPGDLSGYGTAAAGAGAAMNGGPGMMQQPPPSGPSSGPAHVGSLIGSTTPPGGIGAAGGPPSFQQTGLRPEDEIHQFTMFQTLLWLFMMLLTMALTVGPWVYIYFQLRARPSESPWSCWSDLYDSLAAGEPGDPLPTDEIRVVHEADTGVSVKNVSDIADVAVTPPGAGLDYEEADGECWPPMDIPLQPQYSCCFLYEKSFDNAISSSSCSAMADIRHKRVACPCVVPFRVSSNSTVPKYSSPPKTSKPHDES
ncbi:unnamed protein product [Amoebophrya sp. A120]|nr:unnamed protein product [Amoebophrya sp. A120]|eukprot:GSA120T00017010001.1